MSITTKLARSCRGLLAGFWLVALAACAAHPSPVPDLDCRIVVEPGDCSGVPTLEDALLSLSADGGFRLTGRYDACYRVEDVTIEGTYTAFAHEGGIDLELLAERSEGGDPDAKELRRTIGLLNLEDGTWNGRFTDLGAVIRSRGQEKETVSALVRCARK